METTQTKEKTVKSSKTVERTRPASNGMETVVYNTKGKKAGKVKLPEDIFGLPWNADLVAQVIHSMKLNARENIAHTKDRGEVRGGGKKPWQQKGTGRARHGSTRSPIWVHGGVAHGPRNERNFDRKINKKMKTKALFTILSRKMKEGEVLFVDSIDMKQPKTKEARETLSSLSGIKGFNAVLAKRKNSAYIAIPSKNDAVLKSFRNMGNVNVEEARNMNPLDVLQYKHLIIVSPEESLKTLGAKKK